MEFEQPYFGIHQATGAGLFFSREERERTIYIVGKSGSGKSTVLFNLAMRDIESGEGVSVIDPHGDLAEAVADCIPPGRTHQVCYLNVADTTRPVGFNPLAGVRPERRALAASGIVSAFRHLWHDSWGPRTEHLLFHGVAALLDASDTTLIDLPRLYTDETFRMRVVRSLIDPITIRFWTEEFASYDSRFRTEAIAPILNKAGQFAASPNLRLILGQTAPKFQLDHAMNNRQIVIANLAKGVIGEQASNLIGSLLMSHLQLTAMARSSISPEQRVPHFVHVDEFQTFGTEAFSSLLSEARKFATHFCLANQFTEQIPAPVRAAVLGNAGAIIVFRVSAADAHLLAPELHPLPAAALSDQPPFTAWVRRGHSGHAKMSSLPPMMRSHGRRATVIAQSRRHFGRAAAIVEQSFSAASVHDEKRGP